MLIPNLNIKFPIKSEFCILTFETNSAHFIYLFIYLLHPFSVFL
jgi:hypothetical protein